MPCWASVHSRSFRKIAALLLAGRSVIGHLGPMLIVRANLCDASTLSEIAWAAKAFWGYPSEWMEQWRHQLTITTNFIATHETFVAKIDHEIVAFHALLQSPRSMRLEHLWVRPTRMGQGIGRALFRHAAQRAAALGASTLTIEGDPHAAPFYRRMGAVPAGHSTTEYEYGSRKLPLFVFDLTTNLADRLDEERLSL